MPDRWIAMQHKRKFLALDLPSTAWAVWREGNKLPIKAPDGKSGNLRCRTVLREKMLVLGLGNNQLFGCEALGP